MQREHEFRELLNHPDLEPFVVSGVLLTGRQLGSGAYGSVEEVLIPGASCAAKRIHSQLIGLGSRQQVQQWISGFVNECRLMSSLRHPRIVQFIGVCYFPDSLLPFLLMELLLTSLDDLLETKPGIPLDIKMSMLIDIICGLVYLHGHAPAIIHRDLTAKNILLDESLRAKIADLGVARIVNIQLGQVAASMTRAPGNIIYMPPEAVEEGSVRYNTAIDIFSFGNVALFTCTQVFPKDLKAPTYSHPQTRKLVARSEIERRSDYIQLLQQELGERQVLIQLILDCLEYLPEDRPSASFVLDRLRQVQGAIPQTWRMTKLDLIQQAQEERQHFERELSRMQVLSQHQQQHIDGQRQELVALRQQVEKQPLPLSQSQQPSQHVSVGQQLPAPTKKQLPTATWNVSCWKKLNDIPEGTFPDGLPVLVNGRVYVRVNSIGVSEFSPDHDTWIQLPLPPVKYFTVASLNHKLVLVGGRDVHTHQVTSRITVWDGRSCQWVTPYPSLQTLWHSPCVVGLEHYLIVAGGMSFENERMTTVEIFDRRSLTSYLADPLPLTDNFYALSTGDTLYVIGCGSKAVLCVDVQDLIHGTTQSESPPENVSVWRFLPNIPYFESSPVAMNGNLLVVGGDKKNVDCDFDYVSAIYVYSPSHRQWIKIGDLQEACSFCPCIVLPSGQLLVLGGWRGRDLVQSVYSGILAML